MGTIFRGSDSQVAYPLSVVMVMRFDLRTPLRLYALDEK